MTPLVSYHLPEKRQTLRRAKRLEWATLFFMFSITVVMYLTMGSSQVMRTAWIEDVLALISPIVFLVAVHCSEKPPDASFPYGYYRATTASFVAAEPPCSCWASTCSTIRDEPRPRYASDYRNGVALRT